MVNVRDVIGQSQAELADCLISCCTTNAPLPIQPWPLDRDAVVASNLNSTWSISQFPLMDSPQNMSERNVEFEPRDCGNAAAPVLYSSLISRHIQVPRKR